MPTFCSLSRRLALLAVAFCLGNAFAADAATPSQPIRELQFAEFFRLPIGPGGLEISERLHQSAGQTVRLTGYMVRQENAVSGRFLLTPRPVQMSEHADGDADDLPPATVVVYLDPAQQAWSVPHVRGLLALTGVLSVGRAEDEDGRVSWVRLQLAPDAVRQLLPPESGSLPTASHSHH